jgi:hypothetical protein
VLSSDQATTLPPLPVLTASALICASASIKVALARCSLPEPCQLPPSSTVPPPASPEASTRAPANSPTLSPSTLTVPPVWPAP